MYLFAEALVRLRSLKALTYIGMYVCNCTCGPFLLPPRAHLHIQIHFVPCETLNLLPLPFPLATAAAAAHFMPLTLG